MPGRPHPLLTDYTYHVFNKTIDQKRLFEDKDLCQMFLNIIWHYRSTNSYLRFSNFKKLPEELRKPYAKKINDKRSFRISILAYCIMPTHYHFLLRQNQNTGISRFVSQIQNSFTRYFNRKHERSGPIFLQTFKSKPIISEEQLKHISRYVHLNPYSGRIITLIEDVREYPWSSFSDYISLSKAKLSEPENVLSFFKNNKERYRKFVLDNSAHQKMLEYCKYAEKW
ncbi:hypothetical protein A3I50_03535 [Candidatus Roizmanbacteria bacterium RIFCSPLOWO2_02_FULL_37_9]|uniref:Transposase IS200-like domain-containing protein n=1 Tax=Candidatus Roizmanbacteria bacterium RIFCSPLOWO2_01_FULL_37_16 TaxID=1802058 RepID=A0A1F7IQB7_9BACT|nr:MAG: hypothetical protein A3B40_01155 [Candidatus Roizmanbacteria bacterium RIFCSPLOWO2_01_FULL_37_16]OGK56270.1 MAG: hypothetical protein A3I50_03535 [Candidatus Roizmanbacteria bacterium RIFCSPLOWO2_02_FULL_37_9]